jgi:hypothetical protein
MPRTPKTSIARWVGRSSTLALTLALLTAACGGSDGGPTSPGTGDPGDGPGDNPGGGDIPAALLDSWYAGDVSSTNFYQPSTGHWDNAGGTGLLYTFKADGTFEYGWRLYSRLYDCETSAMVYRTGTVTSDPASGTLVLHTLTAKMHSEDNCNASGNYDKNIPLEEETLIYELGTDEYGNEVLWMRGPDTEPSAFHRAEFD